MRKAFGLILIITYSSAVGWAAYTYVPQYIFWANELAFDGGPLILALVFLVSFVAFLASLPVLGFARQFELYGDRVWAYLAAGLAGGPLSATLLKLWSEEMIGPSFVGLGWVVFSGCAFLVFPFMWSLLDDGPSSERTAAPGESVEQEVEKLLKEPQPTWLKYDDQQKLLKKIAKLTDQNLLMQAVRYSSSEQARKEALEKIHDEHRLVVLIKVFIKLADKYSQFERDRSLCIRAVEKIANQSLLAELVLKLPNRGYLKSVSAAAVGKITEQKALLDIVHNARYPQAKSHAMAKIDDDAALLSFVSQKSLDYRLKKEAVKRISNPALLVGLAMENDLSIFAPLRCDAVACLTDQADLSALAKSSNDPEVRREATRRLTGQADLIELAKTSPDARVRAAAVEKITDAAQLRAIAKQEKDRLVLQKLCGGRAFKHTVKNCVCTRCGAEVHDYEFRYRDKEQISKIAEVQYDLYACTRCGKTERRNEVGGGID